MSATTFAGVTQLDEFRWMIEEFKVSLYAQELGTAFPISLWRTIIWLLSSPTSIVLLRPEESWRLLYQRTRSCSKHG